jgi:hypothetical protein
VIVLYDITGVNYFFFLISERRGILIASFLNYLQAEGEREVKR